MTYDSTALLDLQEEFENAFSDKLQVVNFFERRKTRLLKVWFVQWEAFVSAEEYCTFWCTLTVDAVRSRAISKVGQDEHWPRCRPLRPQ